MSNAQVTAPTLWKLQSSKIKPVLQSWGLDFTNSTVTSTSFCLTGDNCRTTWPTGGTNDWGRFNTTYGAKALQTSSTFPVWFDGNVFVSSSIRSSGQVNVVSGSNTSTLSPNYLALGDGTSSTILNGSSLTLGQGTGYNSGVFNVNSNGSLSASGTIYAPFADYPNPCVSFIGDTDTGFCAPYANQLYFYSGGVTSFIARSAGNLQFKTWTMTNTGDIATVTGADTSDATAYGFKVSNENTLNTPGSKIVGFYNDNLITERAFIDASGTAAFGISTGFNEGVFRILNTGNVFASGSLKTFGNVTSTGNLYVLTGTASTSILNGSSLTLGSGTGYTAGMFAVDSNGNTSVSGTLTIQSKLFDGNFYPSFSYVTSTSFTGTTTIPLGVSFIAETWTGVMCFTDSGTVNVSFYDGTNRMNLFNASTTVGTVTLSTNNTFTVAEKRYVDIGTPSGSPTKISCTVKKNF